MPPPTSSLEDHAGYWLRFVSNHVSQAFARKVESKGVTVAEWVLLRKMLEAGTAHPSDLAKAVGLTRGAISRLVERLCVKGLAVRFASDTDRRYQTVELTPRGRRLVPTLARLADRNDGEFFGHMTPDEKAQLVLQLREIVQHHGWKELPLQ